MKTYRMRAEVDVLVTLDETKFDAAFMAEFSRYLYPFKTLEEHAEHVGQLTARGLFNEKFIEGYGNPTEMGIVSEIDDSGFFEIEEPTLVETSCSHTSLLAARQMFADRDIAAKAATAAEAP